MNTEVETFILCIKDQGLSKVASIVKVASTFNLGMDVAKKLVHESAAWAPEKQAHEDFQQQLEIALESDTQNPPETDNL